MEGTLTNALIRDIAQYERNNPNGLMTFSLPSPELMGFVRSDSADGIITDCSRFMPVSEFPTVSAEVVAGRSRERAYLETVRVGTSFAAATHTPLVVPYDVFSDAHKKLLQEYDYKPESTDYISYNPAVAFGDRYVPLQTITWVIGQRRDFPERPFVPFFVNTQGFHELDASTQDHILEDVEKRSDYASHLLSRLYNSWTLPRLMSVIEEAHQKGVIQTMPTHQSLLIHPHRVPRYFALGKDTNAKETGNGLGPASVDTLHWHNIAKIPIGLFNRLVSGRDENVLTHPDEVKRYQEFMHMLEGREFYRGSVTWEPLDKKTYYSLKQLDPYGNILYEALAPFYERHLMEQFSAEGEPPVVKRISNVSLDNRADSRDARGWEVRLPASMNYPGALKSLLAFQQDMTHFRAKAYNAYEESQRTGSKDPLLALQAEFDLPQSALDFYFRSPPQPTIEIAKRTGQEHITARYERRKALDDLLLLYNADPSVEHQSPEFYNALEEYISQWIKQNIPDSEENFDNKVEEVIERERRHVLNELQRKSRDGKLSPFVRKTMQELERYLFSPLAQRMNMLKISGLVITFKEQIIDEKRHYIMYLSLEEGHAGPFEKLSGASLGARQRPL